MMTVSQIIRDADPQTRLEIYAGFRTHRFCPHRAHRLPAPNTVVSFTGELLAIVADIAVVGLDDFVHIPRPRNLALTTCPVHHSRPI